MPKKPNYGMRRVGAVAIPTVAAHLAATAAAGDTGLPLTAPILAGAAATYGMVKLADYGQKLKQKHEDLSPNQFKDY